MFNKYSMSKTTIQSLCLSGGGVYLIKQLGIIQILEKNNIWKLENIKSIFATSSGVWLSILILLKIDWDIINDYIIKRPWKETINMSLIQLLDIYDEKGIFDIEIINMFFEPLFLSKNISIDINLKDFFEITKIELFIYTFEINNIQIIELSHNNYPNLKLIDALYMSSCIPLLFKPFIDDSNEEDIKCYIDGGINNNYPLNNCLKYNENNQETILSIKNIFNYKIENSNKNINKKTNTIDYISIFILKILEMLNNKDERIMKNIKNEIICVSSPMTLQNFINVICDENIRNILLNEGLEIGKKYLDNIYYENDKTKINENDATLSTYGGNNEK